MALGLIQKTGGDETPSQTHAKPVTLLHLFIGKKSEYILCIYNVLAQQDREIRERKTRSHEGCPEEKDINWNSHPFYLKYINKYSTRIVYISQPETSFI